MSLKTTAGFCAMLVLLAIVLLLAGAHPGIEALAGTIAAAMDNRPTENPSQLLGSKPVLSHYLLDPVPAAQFQVDLALSQEQLALVLASAEQEAAMVYRLESESQAILKDPALTRQQKIDWVKASRYNQRLLAALQTNQTRLEQRLGSPVYLRLADWIANRWRDDSQPGFIPPAGIKVHAGPAPQSAVALQKTYPRSFEVYATRYDAGERKIVALPDKCLKFANGGAMQCDGYDYGQNYSVAISYEGNLVVATVGESGPWNVDDNYWSKLNDPQPRRMFADLPLGLPEAQAAYFDGYNGGLDQFGRLVTSPVAIDISRALAADLGLGPGNNKVTVSFLWTEGWDSSVKQPGGGSPQPAASAPPAVPAIAWQTAAPEADGSVVHIVQTGQTLVGIATIYNIPLADLLALNNLTMQSIIQPGDRILVKSPEPTATVSQSTPIPSPVAAFSITETSTPTPTFQKTVTNATKTPTSTALKAPTSADISGDAGAPQIDRLLMIILVVGAAGIILLTWGLIAQHKR